MIRVDLQPEPIDFDARVRQKGLAHLRRRNLPLNLPLPPSTEIEPYWRDCLDDLYRSYHGTCAYLAVFFERVTGGASTDHFIAKSRMPELAYEWSNYRLACSILNSRKRAYEDVLDPITIQSGWFHLELITGRIYSSPYLPEDVRDKVNATIDRLGLDEEDIREMRARHYQEYRDGLYTSDFLRKHSPFVWHEAFRQDLL